MTKEEAIKQLKKLKSFHNGSYGEAVNFAIESIKADRAYNLAYEKVDFIETPEGATNGDMIKAMFPSASETDHFIVNSPIGNIIYIRLEKYQEMRVQQDWWNAPYKAESEVSK